MKRLLLFVFLYVLTILAVLISCSGFTQTFDLAESVPTFTEFIEYIFLYTPPGTPIEFSSSKLLLYFSILLFSCYILILHSFDNNTKYRSLLILRYGAKCRYYWHSLWEIFIRSVRMVVFIAATLLLCSCIFSIPICITLDTCRRFLLFFINLQLFYFLVGLLNFFCTLHFNDSVSTLTCLSFSSFVLVFDAYHPGLKLIVFGDEPKLLVGCAVLCFIAALFSVIMRINVKRTDLL